MDKGLQVAKFASVHRCFGCRKTFKAKWGQQMPPCDCGGKWECLKRDNIAGEPVFVAVGRRYVNEGPGEWGWVKYGFWTDRIPQVMEFINLRGGWDGKDLNGLCRVVRQGVLPNTIQIGPPGQIDPFRPIHVLETQME